ncbi:hypothetical protein GCM10009624_21750 [Gordonia sinesedis]
MSVVALRCPAGAAEADGHSGEAARGGLHPYKADDVKADRGGVHREMGRGGVHREVDRGGRADGEIRLREVTSGTATVPDGLDTVTRLRRRMAAMSGAAGIPDRFGPDGAARPIDVLALPDALSDLLPHQGITRGSVLCYTGAPSLMAAVIASVTRAGGQVGIVGLPRFGLLSATEMGADLARIAAVPDPGVDPVDVASVLLDGMDLVILGLRGLTVPPSRSRVVTGRVRQQAAALMVVDGSWPGAQIHLDAEVLGYRHIPDIDGDSDLAVARRGHGRIGGMRLRVAATGRDRRRRVADIDLHPTGFGTDIGRSVVLTRSDTGTPDSETIVAVAN